MSYKYPSFPRLNDHGVGCKGHGNWMLDNDLSKSDDREVLVRAIDNYLPKNEKVSNQKKEQVADKYASSEALGTV